MRFFLTQREMDKIFNHQNNCGETIANGIDVYKKRPRFRTPYQNTSDFVTGVAAPIVYPLAGAVLSVFSACASVAAFIAAGCLSIAGGLISIGNAPLGKEVLNFAYNALQFSAAALLYSVAGAVFGLLSIPATIFSLVTRTVASLAKVTLGYSDDYVPEPVSDNGHSDVGCVCI